MTAWTLVEATDVECTMDDSGVYTVINRTNNRLCGWGINRVFVRADLMRASDGEPLVSFIGTANNVRKRLIAWIRENCWTPGDGVLDPISPEHASYIGYELMRAESDPEYVQD